MDSFMTYLHTNMLQSVKFDGLLEEVSKFLSTDISIGIQSLIYY